MGYNYLLQRKASKKKDKCFIILKISALNKSGKFFSINTRTFLFEFFLSHIVKTVKWYL